MDVSFFLEKRKELWWEDIDPDDGDILWYTLIMFFLFHSLTSLPSLIVRFVLS